MPTNYFVFLINAKCKFIFKLIQLSKFNHTQDKMKDIFIFGGQVTSLFPNYTKHILEANEMESPI